VRRGGGADLGSFSRGNGPVSHIGNSIDSPDPEFVGDGIHELGWEEDGEDQEGQQGRLLGSPNSESDPASHLDCTGVGGGSMGGGSLNSVTVTPFGQHAASMPHNLAVSSGRLERRTHDG